MIRKLELLIITVVLVVAAFSTAEPFLFYLLYLAILVIGGSYVAGPPRPVRPRGGLRGQPAPRPRRRPDARDLHAAQHEPDAEALARDPQPDDAAGRPAGPGDHARRPERAVVAHPGAAVAPRPLPDRAAAHPDRRPVRVLRGVGDGRAGDQRRRLSADRAAAALAPAGGRPRGQPRLARADPADDADGDLGPAVRAGRRDEPDPLEDDGPPRRDPGQGVRPRADRRRLDHPRPPAQHPDRPRRRVDGRGRDPGGGVDRGSGAPGEPGGRDDRQRRAGPRSCRRTAAAASTSRSCSSSPPSRPTRARRSSRRSSRPSGGSGAG